MAACKGVQRTPRGGPERRSKEDKEKEERGEKREEGKKKDRRKKRDDEDYSRRFTGPETQAPEWSQHADDIPTK
jgi:hypothetical protein